MRRSVLLFLIFLGTAFPVFSEELTSLVKRCGPAVVVFRYAEDQSVLGSGVLVGSDGVVLTAEHLFDDKTEFTVELHGGEKLPVKRFLYRNAELDLAALEVAGSNLPSVPIANSDQSALGSTVVAIGNPQGFENTVSQGVLSGKRAVGNDGQYQIQTTAPISSGSSGGGLFDDKGRLIGIVVSYFTEGQNLNFAIPARYADLTTLHELDQAIQKSPSKVDGYLKRAQAYFDVHEFELALVDVKQALQLDSNAAQAYRIRGEIFYQQERYSESLQDFSTVIRLWPNDAQAYYDRGFTYRDMERHTEAIADFRKAIANDINYVSAYSGLARSLFSLERYQESADAWTEAIQREPDEDSYRGLRGVCYFFAEDYERAADDFAELIKASTELAYPYYYGARIILMGDGDYETAVVLLTAAISLDSETPDFYFHRASAYNRLESYEKALNDIELAVKLNGEDAEARALCGTIFYNLGRYERATNEYSKALELDPDYDQARFDRGDAYAALGNIKAAAQDYHTVVKSDPDSELGRQAKAALAELKR